MTIERRVQITAGILVLFVLGTVLLIFWTSRQVERGLRVSEFVSQLIRYSYMLSTLLNEYQDRGEYPGFGAVGEKSVSCWVRLLMIWSPNTDRLPRSCRKVCKMHFLGGKNSLSPQIPRLATFKPGSNTNRTSNS